jgi:L-ascorbate metabolism protein UlaG (beta-lactamase superfamily)
MSYPRSDHFDGRTFHNLDPDAKARPFSDVWRWHRERRPTPWPRWIPTGFTRFVPPSSRNEIGVTWIGHSTFLIQVGAVSILTDPVFATHAGPFGRIGPRRVRPPALSLAELPAVDLVLQSHNHYDHLDPEAHAALAAASAPKVVTPLGNRGYLPRTVRPQVTELDWWEAAVPIDGVSVTLVPAQHFSARTPWDRDRALWGGFVVKLAGRTIYFAGDTGHGAHFAEIGSRFPGIEVALIPIGAYAPRWFMRPVHVDPEEAVRAHREVGAATSIAMHFGTIQLTDEGIDAPVEWLTRAREDAGLPPAAFRIPEPGVTILL